MMKSLFLHIRDILILPTTVSIVIPYLIYNFKPEIIPGFYSVQALACILFIAGLGLLSWTIYLFQKVAKGTLAPWSEKQKLVVIGPYQYTRNPMISGVLFLLFAEGLWFRSTHILLWAFAFFIITTCVLILKEEPFLEQKFGEEYKRYKEKVPRWIPNMRK